MSRLTVLLLGSLLLAPASFAADRGTYRPGMAYDSIRATDAGICEAQCSGDAQCKGWNFVTVNPNAGQGVCEFNAQDAAPVPSPISISGTNAPSYRSATVIPGRSNTVRVGTPDAPTLSAPSPTRRVVREPVPQAMPTRNASFKRPVNPADMQNLSLTEQQNLQRRTRQNSTPLAGSAPTRPTSPQMRAPAFQHSLDDRRARQPGAQHSRAQQPAPNPMMQADPRLIQHMQQQQMMQRQTMQTQPQQPQPRGAQRARRGEAYATRPVLSPQGRATPPLGQPQYPINTQRPTASPSATSPTPAPNGMLPPQAQRPQMPQPHMQRSPMPQPQAQRPQVRIPAEMSPQMSAGTAQDSLFGSLYDDVKVPRPIDPAAVAANPDAPIPTVANVPVQPVQSGPLPAPRAPIAPGLAGGN